MNIFVYVCVLIDFLLTFVRGEDNMKIHRKISCRERCCTEQRYQFKSRSLFI